MSKIIDMIGKKFGHLTVLFDTGKRQCKSAVYRCRCDCGNEKEINGANLRRGLTTSCGCQQYKIDDVTGKQFGYLTALYPLSTKSGNCTIWHCKCSCGNYTDVSINALNNGHTKSCGCYARHEDLSGKRFGRLLVLKDTGIIKNKQHVYLVQCDCGTIKEVLVGQLTSGRTKSCGCLNHDVLVARNSKYANDNERRLGYVLDNMKERCYNKNCSSYANYGKRGIYICDEWINNSVSFVKWAINAGWKPGLSIDRIDNNGPYAPWNCRFTTQREQTNNTRRNVCITVNGISHTLAEWGDITGYSRSSIQHRKDRNTLVKFLEKWCNEHNYQEPIAKSPFSPEMQSEVFDVVPGFQV